MLKLLPLNLKEVAEVGEVPEVEEVEVQPKQVKSNLRRKLILQDPPQPHLQPHLVVLEAAEEVPEVEPAEVPEVEAVPSLNFRSPQLKKVPVQVETLFKVLLPGNKKVNWIVLPFQVEVREMFLWCLNPILKVIEKEKCKQTVDILQKNQFKKF